MDDGDEVFHGERLARVIGRPVVDPAGVCLGVVVGRILSGTAVDLLVRHRRILHRSQYMRLAGTAITVAGGMLVYRERTTRGRVRLEVVRGGRPGDHAQGDAA